MDYLNLDDKGLDQRSLDWLINEDEKQRAKWGCQSHTSDRWMLILGEEIGELNEAVLRGSLEAIKAEAVQCATLCLKIAKMVDEKI